MPHGTRARWTRFVTAGLAMLLCTGLIGCMNWDKNKDTKSKQKVVPGLPGLPLLDAAGQPERSKTGFANSDPQPGTGNNRTATNGLNSNKSGQPPQQIYQPQPGGGGGIHAPTQPGIQQPGIPVGGGVQPKNPHDAISTAPPPPDLGPLPPLPQDTIIPTGSHDNPSAVLPPVPAVLPPVTPDFATGKGG